MIINTKWHQFDIQPLSIVKFLDRAGIYSIWAKNYDNQTFTMIYVGETGDFEQRLDESHHKYKAWLENARNGLFVSIYLMPTAQYSKEMRLATEQNLINQYKPICNG